MGTFSANTTIEIDRATAAGLTMSGAQYAVATYINASAASVPPFITAHFGPSQTIPSTISASGQTFTLFSGVVFKNTP